MAQSAAWILVHSIFSIRVARPKTVRRFAADDDQRFTNRGHGIRIQEPNGSQMNERTGVLIHMMGNRRFWNINQHTQEQFMLCNGLESNGLDPGQKKNIKKLSFNAI